MSRIRTIIAAGRAYECERLGPQSAAEVSDAPGATWRAEKTLDVEWKAQRPFSTYMGGGRKRGMAPPLSWRPFHRQPPT